MFKNELDLLEIRFNELYDCVDFFVIVESDFSHTLRAKPYIFEKNLERFRPWLHKVRYIKHTSGMFQDPWANESAQRLDISQGLFDVSADDIVIVGDADEIVRHSCIDLLCDHKDSQLFGFSMPLFNFKFNYMRISPGCYDTWTMAATGKWLQTNNVQQLRNVRFDPTKFKKIDHGGWHFGYLGDHQSLYEKALDSCHQQDSFPEFLEQIDMNKSIDEKKCWNRQWPYRYEVVNLDEYFPKSCQNYIQYCLPNSGISARDILSTYAS